MAHGGPKQWWALIQCWRGTQNKPIYSLHHALKQIIHRPKILCKIMAFKRVLKQVQYGGLKQYWARNEIRKWAQKNDLFSFGRSSKQQACMAKKWYKNEPKKGGNGTYPWRQVFGCFLAWEVMPPSCWKAPQAAGNGVVGVVLGGDEEKRCRTWLF